MKKDYNKYLFSIYYFSFGGEFMKTEDFDYNLPKELIAQTPLKNRNASRMMVLDKKTG